MTTTVTLDAYVLDTLLPDLVGHDRRPSAYLVYLYLWRQSEGGARTCRGHSLATVAELTGLSKRSVQTAVTHLEQRQLVEVHRSTPSSVPEYRINTPWRRRARGTESGSSRPGGAT